MPSVNDEALVALRGALLQAREGRLRAIEGAEDVLAALSPGPREGWSMALALAQRRVLGSGDARPTPERVARWFDETKQSEPMAWICELLARDAILELDGGALETWVALHAQVQDVSSRSRTSHRLNAAWLALFRGRSEPELDLGELQREAANDGAADLVVDAVALRALFAMNQDQLSEATTLARRASRMARVESFPHCEYLSNLVLARLRRRAGSPHLAARIVSALAQVAPQPYRGWLAWELCFAGAPSRARELLSHDGAEPSIARSASDHLLEALDAAGVGDANAMQTSGADCRRALGACAFLRAELDELLAAIDPEIPLATMNGELRAWCAGDTREPPPALRGWAGVESTYVIQPASDSPRRLLGVAVALARSVPVVPSKKPGARADIALAVLTLAGRDGLTDEALFRASYGFEYRLSSHRSALDVLKHRLRARLTASMELRRVGDRNVLASSTPLTVADPRCVRRTSDRVLRTLATNRASAKDVAEALHVGVRTAQKALQELVHEGICVIEKEGRRVIYVVEDTTFREPTRY